jgi:phosphatidylglycerophosphate synthase
MTFTDRLRQLFQHFLENAGQTLFRYGVSANLVTLLGLLGSVIAAILAAHGYLLAGGIVLACTGPLDAIDGRWHARKEKSPVLSFL